MYNFIKCDAYTDRQTTPSKMKIIAANNLQILSTQDALIQLTPLRFAECSVIFFISKSKVTHSQSPQQNQGENLDFMSQPCTSITE